MDCSVLDVKDIEVIKKDDYFIVKRSKKYFRLGSSEAKLLKDLLEIRNFKKVSEKNNVSESELMDFVQALKDIGILGGLAKEKKNYLFYHVPFVNPNRFLDVFVKKAFQFKVVNILLITLLSTIIITGLFYFCTNFPAFSSNFLRGFGVNEFILFYSASVIAVLLHELGHAIVCKYYGGKVEEIGLLFIFFSPALYCDVSSIREFKGKKERILTLLAGIFVQLIIFSCMSILFIEVYPNSSWVATFTYWNLIMVLVNIIPFIRLDGYWILSTILNVPNLYAKSFQLALGLKQNILFNESEQRKKVYIKIYGYLNFIFVIFSIFSGFVGVYYMSSLLDGVYKMIMVTIQLSLYLLISIFFIRFIYKIIKKPKSSY